MATGWVISIKLMLISIVVLSTAVIINNSLPLITEIFNELPLIYSFMVSWLRPPYLYLVINCIILTIVASSKLQPNKSTASETGSDAGEALRSVPLKVEIGESAGEEEKDKFVDDAVLSSPVVFGYVDSPLLRKQKVPQVEPEVMSTEAGNGSDLKEKDGRDGGNYDEFVISRSEWIPPKREKTVEFAKDSVTVEKPLASTRLSRRKSSKTNPEGRASLGVTKPRRNDTLESTWRNITEGRPMPLTRHLKKSDTWDTQGRRIQDTSSPIHVMTKSETFNDRSSLSPSPVGSGKLRKEASLSQDDLNRRVEAFIRKFNEDMRLQKQQESMNQYWDMVDRRVS